MITMSLKSMPFQVDREYNFSRRESLPILPNYLWKIERGIVRSITWNEQGNIIVLGFWGQGEILGNHFSQAHPLEMTCLTSVKVIQVGYKDVLNDFSLNKILLSQLQKTEDFLLIMHQKIIANRLLFFLEWLGKQFGQITPEGWVLNLRLTHQEIAETICTSRVTITRLLQDFQRKGKIRKHRDSLLIYQECI
jgi:CRP-like cAMP-binding protein